MVWNKQIIYGSSNSADQTLYQIVTSSILTYFFLQTSGVIIYNFTAVGYWDDCTYFYIAMSFYDNSYTFQAWLVLLQWLYCFVVFRYSLLSDIGWSQHKTLNQRWEQSWRSMNCQSSFKIGSYLYVVHIRAFCNFIY